MALAPPGSPRPQVALTPSRLAESWGPGAFEREISQRRRLWCPWGPEQEAGPWPSRGPMSSAEKADRGAASPVGVLTPPQQHMTSDPLHGHTCAHAARTLAVFVYLRVRGLPQVGPHLPCTHKGTPAAGGHIRAASSRVCTGWGGHTPKKPTDGYTRAHHPPPSFPESLPLGVRPQGSPTVCIRAQRPDQRRPGLGGAAAATVRGRGSGPSHPGSSHPGS